MAIYAYPDALVETEWVKHNLNKPGVRIVEIDVDTKAYAAGHIPGAVAFNWQTQLQDQVRRDIISKEAFEKLMGSAGIRPTDTVVLYGDNHNWFAAYGLWLFKIYGHKDVRLMNGGRTKWLNEQDRELTTELPKITPTEYRASEPNFEIRAMFGHVLDAQARKSCNLVDVRSADEFTGKVIAPAGMTETAQRAGRVPGARNVPWDMAVRTDGTFKSADELRDLYLGEKRLDPAKETVAYCRIGERSAHTWFALKYLLGLPNVRSYDGSWTEYGSVVGAPIEKGGA